MADYYHRDLSPSGLSYPVASFLHLRSPFSFVAPFRRIRCDVTLNANDAMVAMSFLLHFCIGYKILLS